jgi:nitrite reductase/ring-hydroxylating ferredoxin subunit
LEAVPLSEWHVGPSDEITVDQRKILDAGGREIVVFRFGNRCYAMDNWCLHMGGPVGEGRIVGRVEAVLDDQMRCLGERFSETEIHLVCPWHGYEYNIATGEYAGDRRMRLRTYEVVEREGQVYVVA